MNGIQVNGIRTKDPEMNSISPFQTKMPQMSLKAPISSVVALSDEPVTATDNTEPSTATLGTRPDVMHLTALGAVILSSSSRPITSVAPPQESVFTTTEPVNATKTGGDLEVDGVVMAAPGLATTDNNGNIIKVPLAAAAIVPAGGTISTESTGVDAATAATGIQTQPVEIPPALQTALSGTTDPAATTPAGFVLVGTIKLPNGLEAERYTFHGVAGDEKTEMIVFTQSPLALDDILQTDGISFGDVQLIKPSISYYAANTTSGRTPGLWLEGNLVFTGRLSEIGEDLKDVFGQDSTEINITAHLGGFSTWKEAIKPPPDFSLQASMPSIKAQLGSYIEFNSWTLTCQAVRVSDDATPPKQSYAWGFMFTGQLTLTTPGSVSPLLLDYGFNR